MKFLTLILALSLTACAEIATQHVGVVTHWGKVDPNGTKEPGISLYNPFLGTGIHDINGEVVTTKFGGENGLDALTHDRQEVHTWVTVNTQTDLSKAIYIYSNFKDNLKESIVDPQSLQAIKATTALYDAADQIQKRPELRQRMQDNLANALRPYGVNVVGLSIENLVYNPEYQKAVEATAIALQNQIKANAQLTVANTEAKTAAAVARGQADAQRELARGVSAQSLQYETLQLLKEKWHGDFPTTVVMGSAGGNGTGLLLQLLGAK